MNLKIHILCLISLNSCNNNSWDTDGNKISKKTTDTIKICSNIEDIIDRNIGLREMSNPYKPTYAYMTFIADSSDDNKCYLRIFFTRIKQKIDFINDSLDFRYLHIKGRLIFLVKNSDINEVMSRYLEFDSTHFEYKPWYYDLYLDTNRCLVYPIFNQQ